MQYVDQLITARRQLLEDKADKEVDKGVDKKVDKGQRNSTFGRMLQRLRRERGLTQEGLAQQAFCAVDTIKKLESGVRRPSRDLAERFADVLALDGDEREQFLRAAREGVTHTREPQREAPSRRIKLPQPTTPLVDRRAEVATLTDLLTQETTRLVTITGPGGMGKTRLAVAVADALKDSPRFVDGLYFIALAALDSPTHITVALAETFELPLESGAAKRTPLRQLLDFLRDKQLLLILDNVEHLLGYTEAQDAAEIVAALLADAPGVTILATSRERLQLSQEHLYPLGGLETSGASHPAPDAVTEVVTDAATDLFVQRARRLRPDFASVEALTNEEREQITRICRLVEGMPLAIELAAGWVDTLPLDQIADEIEQGLDLLATELRDVPPRQRNIRCLFDASYRRLPAAEQAIFRHLGVLCGGGSTESARSITGASLAQLHRLIAASLVTYDPARGRYILHELLRQYALEKLGAESQEEAVARQHQADYYINFLQEKGALLSGREQHEALAALDPERLNVRSAWQWAAQHGQIDYLARAADALGYYLEWRAAFDAGADAFAEAARAVEGNMNAPGALALLPKLLAWQSVFRRLQGDVVGAEAVLGRARQLAERQPEGAAQQATLAFVLLQLGLVTSEGLPDDPRPYLEQSLAIYQALGMRWEASHALLWLGDHARYQGRFVEARQYFRSALEMRQEAGDRRGIAEVLIWDAHVAADMGEVVEAELLARQACDLYDEFGDQANRAFGLGELSVMLMYAGKYEEALEVVEESLALYQKLGNRTMSLYAQGWLSVAYLGTGRYDAAKEVCVTMNAHMDELRGAQSGVAFMRLYAGWVALALGEYVEAEALLQESFTLHREAGNLGLVSWPLAQLGFLHWLLGDPVRARGELYTVIKTAVEQHASIPLLLALPAVALVLAEEGKLERAAQLAALAWSQPMLANGRNYRDLYGARLEAKLAQLSPAQAVAAQQRGGELDLWQSAAALEAELRASGWAASGANGVSTLGQQASTGGLARNPR